MVHCPLFSHFDYCSVPSNISKSTITCALVASEKEPKVMLLGLLSWLGGVMLSGVSLVSLYISELMTFHLDH